jgi:hypothetical protein
MWDLLGGYTCFSRSLYSDRGGIHSGGMGLYFVSFIEGETSEEDLTS